mmetsp:Transcript_25713/g.28040  ORF Transcript_25713/g.28040 Transcript_25713/m.28040 type:complete len:740 (+) Transcript_25713:101-2320(+)
MEIFYKSTTKIKPAQHLAKEVEEGNHEYKFKLSNLTDVQLNHRITQLQWRLNEGNNEAIYHIGVEDDGNALGLSDSDMNESLKTLQYMADQVGCDMCVRQLYAGEQGLTAEVVMTRRERLTVDTIHLTVTVAGDLDAGKSTMIGVLSSGLLDNGKGLARTRVFLHNHEIETGRTSCVSHTVLHFDKDGGILNSEGNYGNLAVKKNHRVRALSDLELADETTRSVTLIDLAGHPKYLKTTVHGMLGRKPDYCLVCISVLAGLQEMTSEHIGIGLSLGVPLIFVITKIDALGVPFAQATKHPKFECLMNSIVALFPDQSRVFPVIDSNKALIDLLSPNDGASFLGSLSGSNTPKTIFPILPVSNTTGDGLSLLQSLLYQLPDLSKATGKLEMRSETAVNEECGSELLLRNGNYIRILGSIGCAGSDDDVLDEDEDDDSVPQNTSIEDQLQVIQEELCGLITSSTVDEEDVSPRTALNQEAANDVYLKFHDQILRYKSSLAELSHFVDLSVTQKPRNSKILIGKVISGKLQVSDDIYFGPTLQGDFIPVTIASIRLNNVPVRYATAGQTATFRLIRVQKRFVQDFSPLVIHNDSISSSTNQEMFSVSQRRRGNASGLVLMSSQLEPRSCLEFEAEIEVVNHPSKIRVNYEPVIHVGAVRQTGKIVSIENLERLTTISDEEKVLEDFIPKSATSITSDEVGNGEVAIMRFRFLYHPEFITIGETIVIREDRMKGRGVITKIVR